MQPLMAHGGSPHRARRRERPTLVGKSSSKMEAKGRRQDAHGKKARQAGGGRRRPREAVAPADRSYTLG